MRRVYTKELLEEKAEKSTSWADFMRNLGMTVCGGNYSSVQKKAREFGIDTSHFTGQGWSRGKTKETDPRVAKFTRKIQKYSDADLLSENAPSWVGGSKLKPILLRNGFVYKCAECGINEWKGSPLTLHVDHINGINNDNRKENLRFLCPNCHQQTPTWGRMKR